MSYNSRTLKLIQLELLNFKEKYFKEVAWVIAGQISMIILGVVSIKLLTTMPHSEYGKYNLVLALSAFLTSILYGPAEQGFVRYYFEYKKAALEGQFFKMILKFLLYAGLFIFLLFSVFYLAATFLFNNMVKQYNFLAVINIVIFIIVSSSNLAFNSILNLLRKRQLNALFSISERIISLLFISLIIFFSSLDAQLVLVSMTVAASVFLVLKFLKVRKFFTDENIEMNELATQNLKKLKNQMVTFCLPFLVWGITGWVQISSDKFIISNYLNISNVGLYSLIFTITSYLISTPVNIITQFIQPVVYEKILNSSKNEEIKLGYKLMNYALVLILVLICFLFIFTFFWGNSLILLLSNNTYLYHINLLPILCLGVGIFQLAQFYIMFGFINNTPNIYLPAKIISGIFAVIFNIYFINKYQLLGITLSLLLVSLVYFSLVIYANKKIGIRLFTKSTSVISK
ncbi:MAG: oligosaccharide flippase family protein [Ferruginibacter sp.]|nr:oligosaccharide flippase family protein [Ferruginibacter sp.]